MMDKIICWSLENRFVVIMLTVLVLVVGIQSALRLPVDAFPDTTPVQVQVNTVATNLSPEEIEQRITFPVEQVMSGITGLKEVRSVSKFGLSQTTLIFEDHVDIYFARQRVMEQLQSLSWPEDISSPELGPVATGLGEVYHYIVTGDRKTLEELTTIHDWEIKPRLRSLPGVAEVNTWGGMQKQYHVLVDLNRLLKYGLTLDDVSDALKMNNLSVGGGTISQSGESLIVQGLSLTKTISDIEKIVLRTHQGTSVFIRDVAEVSLGHPVRRGAATADGKGEVVLGLGFMLMGENSWKVTELFKKRMEEIKKTLPEGIEVTPVYERTDLVRQVLDTVKTNLFEGALLVMAILLAFLGSLRAGIIVALVIPFSLLFAMNGMLYFGIAASLMSLGAIDFGLIVDSAVIMIENSVRRLKEAPANLSIKDVVREASLEVRKPTMFGELMIMIVYLPVLMLEGIEGKMFRPMAWTVIFALAGSLVMSITLMPVLASFFLTRAHRDKKNVLMHFLESVYRPLVQSAVNYRKKFILLAVVLLVLGVGLSFRLGTEFIPRLSEMGIAINTVRLAGVSLDESVRYGTQIEKDILSAFPDEVKHIWTRTGTAEVATDPMGIEVSDVFITLKPRKSWKKARTQDELVALIRKELSGLPGMRMVFSQPIEMRINEMVAGIRSDLGIKIFGPDLEVLKQIASQTGEIVKNIPGAADVYVEQITGQPVLEIRVDQDAIARYGVPAKHVLEVVEAIGTRKIGEIREGQRRFDLVVRLKDTFRNNPGDLERIMIPSSGGENIPLSKLARIEKVVGPSTITREWQSRRILVQCNVKDRDIGTFVQEVKHTLEAELKLEPGYHIEYGGQFEHFERARSRLYIVVPLALALILFLLYMSTESIYRSLIIFTGAPFAMIGGIVALWLRDMPFTISAGVGFVALSGVSMLNGLVMVSTIKNLIGCNVPVNEAVLEGAVSRLRPVLMTALVAGVGFLPMAFNTGVGAEVQRPLATVVVGGVLSDTLLTLLILPAFCSLSHVWKAKE